MTREKVTDGANERAIDETIAGTAPGIPDDAPLPGREQRGNGLRWWQAVWLLLPCRNDFRPFSLTW